MDKYQIYKPSGVEWIGEIPSHWEINRLKWVTKIENSGIWGEDDEFPNSINVPIPTTGQLSIEGEWYYDKMNFRHLSKEDWNKYKCVEGDIVVVKSSGSSTNIITGKCGFISKEDSEKFGFSNFLLRVRPLKITPKLVYYFLSSNLTKQRIERMVSSTTYPNLKVDEYSNSELLIPPFQEQYQIVEFLDSKTELIDKLISTKERKITLLKEQRTSLINEVVTKGLNPNVKMKNTGIEWIGEIPEHWSMVSIKNLVSTKITDGPHETPEWVEEGIPFLSVESVQDNKLDFNKKRGYITEELHKIYSKKCKPQRDDIFIVKSGSTTGKSTIVETDEEFNIWSPLCIVRSNKDKILPRFLFNSIQSFYFRRFIELGWSFGTQPNIGMGVIENLKIVLPPLQEQQPIIDFLNHKIIDIDNLVDLEQKKIDLLKEYRQSLISEVVTGKIKVTTDE